VSLLPRKIVRDLELDFRVRARTVSSYTPVEREGSPGGLLGGEQFEPVESNPMIGRRGAYRYLESPDEFLLELRAVARVLDEGLDNVHLMIPFVRTVEELRHLKEIIRGQALFDRVAPYFCTQPCYFGGPFALNWASDEDEHLDRSDPIGTREPTAPTQPVHDGPQRDQRGDAADDGRDAPEDRVILVRREDGDLDHEEQQHDRNNRDPHVA